MNVTLWEGGSAPARFDIRNDDWRPPVGLAVGDTIATTGNGIEAMVLWLCDDWFACWGLDCGDAPFAMDAEGVCRPLEAMTDGEWSEVETLAEIGVVMPRACEQIGSLVRAGLLRVAEQ